MSKIRVAAVSYLNTRPLLYGIRHHRISEELELQVDYPARIAEQLLKGSVDLALIPVAMIPRLPQSHIITDYCIGCEGPVASVCIFSEVPIEEITEVYLDYQSRTSVNLAKVLLGHHWKKEVRFVDATGEDYRQRIGGTTAAVVIGDRALEQRQGASYIYDLGEEWIRFTGLPFVFAAWVSTRELPPAFINGFNEANALGLAHLEEVIRENPYPFYDLHTYYTENISYTLTAGKREGLKLFTKYLSLYI